MSGGTPRGGGGYIRQRHSQGYASGGDDLEDDACSRHQPFSLESPRCKTWVEVLENVLWIASAVFIVYFGDMHSNMIYILLHDARIKRGARVVPGQKSVKVNIDPGVDNSDTIKVGRAGGADPEGDQPGDLYVIFKVREDPVFRREGSDIHVNSVLSVTQAILGGTIQVPTLTGDVVVKVRPGTQPGQKVVLRNKGIRARKSTRFGDQYVHFNVSIPANITQRQRELLEEFVKEEQGEYEKRTASGSSQ